MGVMPVTWMEALLWRWLTPVPDHRYHFHLSAEILVLQEPPDVHASVPEDFQGSLLLHSEAGNNSSPL